MGQNPTPTARRAWLGADDVINARGLADVMKSFR